MQIPIQNIYFLLCYAWDKLDEKNVVNINASDYNSLLDLFSKVLINGTSYLLKRGLDRDYKLKEDTVSGVKGKMNISETIKNNLLVKKKTLCQFDEFDYDIIHNQIVKTTLEKILRTKDVDETLKHQIWVLLKRLPYIQSIHLTSSIYKKVRLHRNNRFYNFLLNVCQIINENLQVNEKSGEFKFIEFDKDDNKMPYVFEGFVRNFYKLEQSEFKVFRENINWKVIPEITGDEAYLPKMETDISLKSERRKIIIDTKYYKEALKYHYGREKIISSNLYQIHAYVKNQVTPDDILAQKCDGVLLYPSVNKTISKSYKMDNHKITIQTINLNQDWRKIREDLLEIIDI